MPSSCQVWLASFAGFPKIILYETSVHTNGLESYQKTNDHTTIRLTSNESCIFLFYRAIDIATISSQAPHVQPENLKSEIEFALPPPPHTARHPFMK
jgi:hypothetical protein